MDNTSHDKPSSLENLFFTEDYEGYRLMFLNSRGLGDPARAPQYAANYREIIDEQVKKAKRLGMKVILINDMTQVHAYQGGPRESITKERDTRPPEIWACEVHLLDGSDTEKVSDLIRLIRLAANIAGMRLIESCDLDAINSSLQQLASSTLPKSNTKHANLFTKPSILAVLEDPSPKGVQEFIEKIVNVIKHYIDSLEHLETTHTETEP